MSTDERSAKAFKNVKEILSRLDRSIDSVRQQRVAPPPPATLAPVSNAGPIDPRRMRAQPIRPKPAGPGVRGEGPSRG